MKASAGIEIALLVAGTGITGAIYVVCAPMISEFTPTSQRGAVIAIYGAIYTLAGVIAPFVMGNIIQNAAVPFDGYINGFVVNGVILIVSGLLGLLLLWPDTELARLRGTTLQPRLA
jgi:MFS family permease